MDPGASTDTWTIGLTPTMVMSVPCRTAGSAPLPTFTPTKHAMGRVTLDLRDMKAVVSTSLERRAGADMALAPNRT